MNKSSGRKKGQRKATSKNKFSAKPRKTHAVDIKISNGGNSNPNQNVQRDSQTFNLDYVEAITQFNNGSGPIVAGDYRANDPYDFDTAILSNSLQYYNYAMTQYYYAKVITAKFVHTFDNYEQFPLEISCFHSSVPLLSSLGSRTQLELVQATALRDSVVMMSEQYGKRSQVKIIQKFSCCSVVGNSFAFLASDDYSATRTSSPPIPIYSTWAVFSPTGIMTNGFFKRTEVKLKIFFYGTRINSSVALLKVDREADGETKRPQQQAEPTGKAQPSEMVVARRGGNPRIRHE